VILPPLVLTGPTQIETKIKLMTIFMGLATQAGQGKYQTGDHIHNTWLPLPLGVMCGHTVDRNHIATKYTKQNVTQHNSRHTVTFDRKANEQIMLSVIQLNVRAPTFLTQITFSRKQ